jgi:3-isopropylmalate/(R)-2-methylmalate dehydratase small subunit
VTALETLSGRAWVFGDNIDTDVLAPGAYMKLPPEQAAKHCLEAVNPMFAQEVAPGDIVVAGANFGLGSSREQAAQALKILGVAAVLARGFARIFYRNAINLGLPAVFFAQTDEVSVHDRLEIELVNGVVRNCTTGKAYNVAPIPAHLLELLRDGGLMPHLAKKLAGSRPEKPVPLESPR